MEVSFEHHDVSTVGAKLAKQVQRRKSRIAARQQDEARMKRPRLNDEGIRQEKTSSPFGSPQNLIGCSSGNSASGGASTFSISCNMIAPARNKGGRPRTKPLDLVPSTKCLQKGTVLRVNRLVQAQIPMDVWLNIFSYAKPDFLFKARFVCKSFNEALLKESAWKQALLQQFGPSLPQPPAGLSQMNYANLLTQYGCQSCRDEGKGSTRRTYWAFQRRYCETCLVDKIVFEKDLRSLAYSHNICSEEIIRSVPKAMYDSWGHYQWAGDYDSPPSWAKAYPNAQKAAFLRSEVLGFMADHHESLSRTPECHDQWLESRYGANDILVGQLQAIENFCELNRLAKLDVAEASRHARKDYYQRQALSMEPLLSSDALELCESYQRAIRISRTPGDLERSWKALLPKLKKDRVKAEADVIKNKRFTKLEDHRQELCFNYDVNLLRRASNDSTEQRFLLTLADMVIAAMTLSGRETPYPNLIPVLLNQLRMTYDRTKSKPGLVHGAEPYRPIMDDVRMIYDLKIAPILANLSLEEQLQANQLKCAFCKPTDSAALQTYLFEDLFEHIADEHRVRAFTPAKSPLVARSRGRVGFPWLTAEWPHTLPILAAHQATPEPWDYEDIWDAAFAPVWQL